MWNNNVSDGALLTLYYLLYSEYGNSVIASSDENQFKYQVFSTIFEYGPTWEKRLEIQNKLRELTDGDLEQGTKTIYNKALNPGNTPSTDELSYINEQTTSNIKRGKLDKYTELYSILDTDVTRDFITKFKKYFLQIVIPEKPLFYVSEGDDSEFTGNINSVYGNFRNRKFTDIWDSAPAFLDDYQNSGLYIQDAPIPE